MRIFFGILLIVAGIYILNSLKEDNRSIGGKLRYALNDNYRNDYETAKVVGYGLLAIGAIMVVLKLISPKKAEAKSSVDTSRLFKKAADYYNREDYANSIAILNQIISVEPSNNKALFSLACCYSLTENSNAFPALIKAVQYGYTDFKKINDYQALNWMRRHPSFEEFKNNGYVVNELPKVGVSVSEAKLSRLERLAKLKEQGIISMTEFEQEKLKILREN